MSDLTKPEHVPSVVSTGEGVQVPTTPSDTEILNWLENNASKVGIKPDWAGVDAKTGALMFEKTDIRKRVRELMNQ